jgi:hypothetical protein
VFLLGIGFYYFFRSPTIAEVFFDINLKSDLAIPNWVHLFQWYPSFAHVFFFVIATWEIMNRQYLSLSIVSWVGLNLLFEVLQHDFFDTFTRQYLAYFFQNGTFDIFDIFAIFLGGVLAYFVIHVKIDSQNNPKSTP